MNKPTNIALLILAAVIAAGAQHFLWGTVKVGDAKSANLESASIEGRVLSVDAAATDESARSAPRYARVKLGTGETVRAIVGGCIIFPGQITRLAKHGEGSSSTYIVTENGRNDS